MIRVEGWWPRNGLRGFDAFYGPASGPAFLSTAGFEFEVLRQAWWRRKNERRRWLCGGSAGAMRFVALLRAVARGGGGEEVLWRFARTFAEMVYDHNSTPEDLERMMEGVFDTLLPSSREEVEAMIDHPAFGLAVFVCRMPPLLASLPRAAMAALGAASFLAPGAEGMVAERLCFHSPSSLPPLRRPGDGITYMPLTAENLRDVLRATTSIPGLSVPRRRIAGREGGWFCDAGVVEYEFNLRPPASCRTLVLNRNVGARLYGTFFDSIFERPRYLPPWVTVLSPSPRLFRAYPHPSIADWFDTHLISNPRERVERWMHAMQTSRAAFDPHPLVTVRPLPRPSARDPMFELLMAVARLWIEVLPV